MTELSPMGVRAQEQRKAVPASVSARVTSMRVRVAGFSFKDDVTADVRILLVDDEERILNFVRRGLQAEGMTVDTARDGEEGLALALSHAYDLVILDLVMPGLDGHEVLERLFAQKPSQPVLVLSALNDVASKVSSLEHGADDYLSKPFSLEELLARVRARLRSASRAEPTTIDTGTLALDMIRREADAGAGPVQLSEREFLLLAELVRNAGHTVSKERLLSSVWGYHFDSGSNVVDVYVRRVRAKIGKDVITTVRGVGYSVDAG
jgi:two-component system, OmpR family, response regulator